MRRTHAFLVSLLLASACGGQSETDEPTRTRSGPGARDRDGGSLDERGDARDAGAEGVRAEPPSRDRPEGAGGSSNPSGPTPIDVTPSVPPAPASGTLEPPAPVTTVVSPPVTAMPPVPTTPVVTPVDPAPEPDPAVPDPTLDVDPCSSEEPIALTSDDDVAALAAHQCESVFSLDISGTVTNLSGLESIREVRGRVYVESTTQLENLKGLENVERTALVVAGSEGLVSLTGLEGVREVSGVVLAGNASLADLSALTNASFAGTSLTITGNAALPNLVGFEGMTEADAIVLDGNTSLTSLAGLDNLQEIRSLLVSNNPALTDLSLPSLVEAEYLTFPNGESIERVHVPLLHTVDSLVIVTCPLLTTIDLGALETASSLTIADNATLVDLGDLAGLASVGTATITENPLLSQCAVDEIAAVVAECTCDGNGPCP